MSRGIGLTRRSRLDVMCRLPVQGEDERRNRPRPTAPAAEGAAVQSISVFMFTSVKGDAHACALLVIVRSRAVRYHPGPHLGGGRYPATPRRHHSRCHHGRRRSSGRARAHVAVTGLSSPGRPIYENEAYSFAERAADLVSRMTLREGLADGFEPGAGDPGASTIPTGVSAYGWWNEALHGVSRLQLAPSGTRPCWTTQPRTRRASPSGPLGSELMYARRRRSPTRPGRSSQQLARPRLLLANGEPRSADPRWGRNDETFSEDPLLTAIWHRSTSMACRARP